MLKQRLSDIEEFLSQKRMAFIGASRNQKHFSRVLLKDLIGFGYDICPVHPVADKIEDIDVYHSVKDINPSIENVLIMLKDEQLLEAITDCITSGVKSIWIYGVIGPKQVLPKAMDVCHNNDINLIAGFCPYMFIKESAFYHRFHGLIWKLIGINPK
jgi:uncharacterized protein